MDAMLILIENDAERDRAAALVSQLIGSIDPGSRARLKAQAQLIQAYEKARWPTPVPDTATIISYLMDQHDLTRAEMATFLGTESRVSELLNGKRGLSIAMLQRIRERFGVPADVLIPERSRTAIRKKVARKVGAIATLRKKRVVVDTKTKKTRPSRSGRMAARKQVARMTRRGARA